MFLPKNAKYVLIHSAADGVAGAGHSLGGALANLAAFDIRKQLMHNGQGDTKVVCYTFAAPRTGNHAFAREYNAMVPDTWSVINDQVTTDSSIDAVRCVRASESRHAYKLLSSAATLIMQSSRDDTPLLVSFFCCHLLITFCFTQFSSSTNSWASI